MAAKAKAGNRKVKRAMHEMKRGKLRSGRSGKKVKSRRQAIAIGLSEARKSGAHIPRKKKGGRAVDQGTARKSGIDSREICGAHTG
jgi:hypothetical protein